jgi:hypothetical protein
MIDLVVDLNLAEVEEQKEEEVLSVSELVLYLPNAFSLTTLLPLNSGLNL